MIQIKPRPLDIRRGLLYIHTIINIGWRIMEFERLKKEKNPVLAVCYDFDRTLTPDDMQAQGFIQSVGADVKEFSTLFPYTTLFRSKSRIWIITLPICI